MTPFREVHISGDLGQALALNDDGRLLFDASGCKSCRDGDARSFFAFAFEVRRVPDHELAVLTPETLSRQVAAEARRHMGLRLALSGMDRRLSAGLRKQSIRQAEDILRHAPNGQFAERRLVRVHDPEVLDPSVSSRVARRDGAGHAAAIYDLIVNPQLPRIERFIRKQSENPDLLDLARETGLVVDTVKALQLQRPQLLERRLGEASELTALTVDVAAKFVPAALRARPVARPVFRHGPTLPGVPTLYNLFGYPSASEFGFEDRIRLKWLGEHAPHRRFYVGGDVHGWMARTGIGLDRALEQAELAPALVVEGTDWSRVDAHWRQPPAQSQFQRVIQGQPMPLDRAGLVLAALSLAANERGLGYGAVFEQLAIIPACYSFPGGASATDAADAFRKRTPTVEDMLEGHPVTLATARRIAGSMAYWLPVSADPDLLLTHGAHAPRSASANEHFSLTEPLEPLPPLPPRDEYGEWDY